MTEGNWQQNNGESWQCADRNSKSLDRNTLSKQAKTYQTLGKTLNHKNKTTTPSSSRHTKLTTSHGLKPQMRPKQKVCRRQPRPMRRMVFCSRQPQMRPKQKVCRRQPRPMRRMVFCSRQPQMRPKQKVCSRQPPHPNRISRNLYINLPQQTHAATKTKPLLLQRNQAYQNDTSEFIDQQTTHKKINTSTCHIGTKQDPSKPWGRPHNSINRQQRYPPWGRHHQTNRYNNPHQAPRGRKSNTHH